MNMVETRTDTASGGKAEGGSQGAQGGAESFSDQAQSAMRGAADKASEMWDEAYEQGERYYRQDSRAIGNLAIDGPVLGALFVGSAVGFAVAWLMFGQYSRSADYMTRRMGESSGRYSPTDNRSRRQRGAAGQ
jgi:hypothetical protein